MIDIIKQTPSELSNQSRDYQIIARLYTALFNISKMYIDNMNVWNDNIDNKLVELRSHTLNFVPSHSWDVEDLEVVSSSFKYLMRNKGTKRAIMMVINILIRVNHFNSSLEDEDVTVGDDLVVTIRLEEGLITAGIIEDILKYILPAGVTYRIKEYKEYTLPNNNISQVIYMPDGQNTISYSYDSDGKYLFIGSEGNIIKDFIYTSSEAADWR